MIDYDKMLIDENFNQYGLLAKHIGPNGADIVVSRNNNIYSVNPVSGAITARATWTPYSSVCIRLTNRDVVYFDLITREHVSDPISDERYLTHSYVDGKILVDIETYRG